MSISTISSRQFNQDTSGAKKAARKGPVFITDRGQPAHVLLTIEEYRRLTGRKKKITDLLAMSKDVEFKPPRLGDLAEPAEFD